EGIAYTSTADEVRDALGLEFELFAATFAVTEAGNWEAGRNILHVAGDRRTVPAQLGLDEAEYRGRLGAAREKLLTARVERQRPARDDKVLAGWNGLMLAAVAEAAAVLDRPDYLEAAQ